MEFILDFILHIDQYMINIVQDYHTWAYAMPIHHYILRNRACSHSLSSW